MPARNIVAVGSSTELDNVIPAISNPKVAGIAYETDSQTLWIYDPVAAAFVGFTVAALNGLTATVAELNALGTNEAALVTLAGDAAVLETLVTDATALEALAAAETNVLSAGATAANFGVAHAIYNFAVDGGAESTITPAVTATIPANAIIKQVLVNSTTALASGGSATFAVGTSAGSSSTALLGATAKASLSADAILPGTPVSAATAVKLSAAGQITVTIGAATLTQGVVEIFVEYYLPTNA
jgi:hypothetical protein